MQSRIIGTIVGIFLSSIPLVVFANCETWTIEIQNFSTKEVKTYKVVPGDKLSIPLQGMKGVNCIFETSRPTTAEELKLNSTAASVLCNSIGNDEIYTTSTGSSCSDGVPQHHGLFLISKTNKRTGKSVLYNFDFYSP